MWLKKVDWLSPPITLYYRGEGSHVSMYSGILSIIAYAIVVVATFYYALNFINREDPKAYFFNRYIEDAGSFPVNSTQMFHFIQLVDVKSNLKVPFDISKFRVFGFDDIHTSEYLADPEIVNTHDHWIYGYCNNDTDTEGISYLIDQDYYKESVCIRKYYDRKKKQYYETSDPNFRWPLILKGCSHPNRTYYGLFIQRCVDAPETIRINGGPECSLSDDIDAYIDKVSLSFQIIDHYADMLNYDMPFTKYFYEVTSAISKENLAIQHLNFNPAYMLTHNGYFFDNRVEENAYFFTQNEKQTKTDNLKGCVIGVFFWMQNTLQYYERTYDRIQDILSDIGGISSIVLTIGGILNLLIHNFIVVLDTENFVINTEQDNYNNRELNKKPTILRNNNAIMNPPRRPYQANRKPTYAIEQQQSSNYQRLMKDGVDIYPNTNSKDEKSNQYNIYIKKNNFINKNYEGNKESFNQKNSGGYSGRGQNNTGNYYQRGETFNTMSRNVKGDSSNENKEEDIDYRPHEKQNFNWCKYLYYLICCGRNDEKIRYYEDFRCKLISEENIIQNYLDIYKLLKHCNVQKTIINIKDE